MVVNSSSLHLHLEAPVYSNQPIEDAASTGYNLWADCQRRTLAPPLNSGYNEAPTWCTDVVGI